MKVFVTGSEGYIGSVLVPFLESRGHEPSGFDAGFYQGPPLYETAAPKAPVRCGDLRRLSCEDLAGFEAVVHLAELSNDPLGELNPRITRAINHEGSVALGRLAREAGVARFVYASSCSVYGAAGAGIRTETSSLDPRTVYADCKVRVERGVGGLAGDSFSPVFLRNATAYGPSPRMRFDLVMNNLCGLAWTERRLRLTSDGTPWRPLVHVEDICRAIAGVLEAPRDAIHGEVFNVGDDDANHRIREIAAIVADAFDGCETVFGSSDPDQRSYRVGFAKIRRHLPEFRCAHTVASGARELRDLFERIGLTADTFRHPAYTRLKQLRRLLEEGRIDEELFWRV